VFICDLDMDSDPGAEGVTYREKEETARKSPRATLVMENNGRSWHAPGISLASKLGRSCLTIIDLQVDIGGAKTLLDAVQGRELCSNIIANGMFLWVGSFVGTTISLYWSTVQLRDSHIDDLITQYFLVPSHNIQRRQTTQVAQDR
jgi:hypothetical protein